MKKKKGRQNFSISTDYYFKLPFGSFFINDIILLCTTANSVVSWACNNCAKISAILGVCSLLSLHNAGKSFIACFLICKKFERKNIN